MTLPLKTVELKRCKPLLGTFVEITATGLTAEVLSSGIHAAFDEIERIQKLLSVYDPDSEISTLNRNAFGESVHVCSETYNLLTRGLELSECSNGAFDFTVEKQLQEWGYSSKMNNGERFLAKLEMKTGNWSDILLLSNGSVKFLKPLEINLGGIAKGYAVDQAVMKLKEYGVKLGIVNAGGDIKAFGPNPMEIQIRHPLDPIHFCHTLKIQDASFATSSPCFSQKNIHGSGVSHLIEPISGLPVTDNVSVSVKASECWLADGLTKVVLNLKDKATKILADYGAEAFIITA